MKFEYVRQKMLTRSGGEYWLNAVIPISYAETKQEY